MGSLALYAAMPKRSLLEARPAKVKWEDVFIVTRADHW